MSTVVEDVGDGEPISEKPKFAPVYVNLWADAAVEGLTDGAFRVFMFFLSSARAQRLPGLFRSSPELIAGEIGRSTNARRVRKALDELERAGLIRRDSRLLRLPKAWEYNLPSNPMHCRAWIRELKALGADQSPIGIETVRDFIAALKAKKTRSYWAPVVATFPNLQTIPPIKGSDCIVKAPSEQQHQVHDQLQDQQQQQPEPAPAGAAAASLGASGPPDIGPAPRDAFDAEVDEALARWNATPHLRPSPPLTLEERASLHAIRHADPTFSLLGLVDDARTSRFLRRAVGNPDKDPRTRRINPTLGELLVRSDYRDLVAKSASRKREPGLRARSAHPAMVEDQRRRSEAARAPAPQRLDFATVERALESAQDPIARRFLAGRCG